MNLPIEKGKISASQFMFSIMCFLQGSTIFSSFYTGATKQDSWIILITGFIACLPFIGIYTFLIKRYPGKTIIEMNEAIFGKFIGKIVSLAYLYFFIMMASLNLNNTGDMVVNNLMVETPEIAVIIFIMIICGYAIYYGIEVTVRYSMIFFISWISGLLLATTLSATNMNLSNFLPVLSFPLKNYLHGTFVASTIPFCGVFFFMMIAPSANDQKLIKKSWFLGVFLGFLPLMIMVLRDTMVLGPLASILSLPSYETLRLINVIEIVNRMEILFAILRLMLMFFKITIICYCVSLGAAQIFNLKSYRSLIIILCTIIVINASILFDSQMIEAAWGKTIAPYFTAFFEMFIPLITFVILIIKDQIKKVKENSQ